MLYLGAIMTSSVEGLAGSIGALTLESDETKILQKVKEEKSYLYLDCRSLSLRSVPCKVITQEPYWASLLSIHLHDNHLSELPPSFANLRSLRVLYLECNRFTIFPEVILQLHKELLGLGLGGNQLSVLPEGIGVLSNLDHLNLSENQLTALPDSLFTITQLDHLFLAGNKLSTLTSKVAAFARLEVLEVESNELEVLPEELCGLKKLRRVIAHDNKLKSLPEGLNCFYLTWKKSISRAQVLANQKQNSLNV
jgi:hypothetical protein